MTKNIVGVLLFSLYTFLSFSSDWVWILSKSTQKCVSFYLRIWLESPGREEPISGLKSKNGPDLRCDLHVWSTSTWVKIVYLQPCIKHVNFHFWPPYTPAIDAARRELFKTGLNCPETPILSLLSSNLCRDPLFSRFPCGATVGILLIEAIKTKHTVFVP